LARACFGTALGLGGADFGIATLRGGGLARFCTDFGTTFGLGGVDLRRGGGGARLGAGFGATAGVTIFGGSDIGVGVGFGESGVGVGVTFEITLGVSGVCVMVGGDGFGFGLYFCFSSNICLACWRRLFSCRNCRLRKMSSFRGLIFFCITECFTKVK